MNLFECCVHTSCMQIILYIIYIMHYFMKNISIFCLIFSNLNIYYSLYLFQRTSSPKRKIFAIEFIDCFISQVLISTLLTLFFTNQYTNIFPANYNCHFLILKFKFWEKILLSFIILTKSWDLIKSVLTIKLYNCMYWNNCAYSNVA